MNWIQLAKGRDKLKVVMITVVNLRVSEHVGSFWSSSFSVTFFSRVCCHVGLDAV